MDRQIRQYFKIWIQRSMYRPIDPYLNVWMHGSMDRRIGPYFKVEMQGIDGPPNRLTAESFDRGWLLGCFFDRKNSVY